MISDAQKKTLTHAATLLRVLAGTVDDEFAQGVAAVLVDARDTASALDTMVNPPKRNGHVHELGSCSDCTNDETKPEGLTVRPKLSALTMRIAADETELGQ
jgi:hypothetical protein